MNTAFNELSRPVIACVDGGDDGDRALRFAIGEAVRRSTGLRLIHVPLEFIPYAPMTPVYKMPNLREIGSQILKDAFDRCFELAPDLYVEGALLTGRRVGAIVEESANAACVVIGTREWKTYRTFSGSTSAGVAARAVCPVIAVPPTWAEHTTPGRVIVGVDSDGGPGVVLEHAFEVARLRGAELTIIHAWTAPKPYESHFETWDRGAWSEVATSALTEQTAHLRAAHSDVVTHLFATYGTALDAISELADEGDLLVIGRHRGHHSHLHRLGSIAQHALHSSRNPIEIVPVPETEADGR